MYSYETNVFAFVILIPLSSADIVQWIPNTSFNLPISYNTGIVPCSKQTVVFEESVSASVKIEADVNIAGLILPNDGEIILEGDIAFGEDGNVNCTDDGNVYYKEKSKSSWLQADVWGSGRFNDATPDSERVPCYDDIVLFPRLTAFTVTLPDTTQNVRQLYVQNMSLDTRTFINFAASGIGQTQFFILNSNGDTGVVVGMKECQSRAGCPCQESSNVIDCSTKFCTVPQCVDPIQPIGHCCRICGGFLSFHIDQTFDYMGFNEAVAKIISTYGANRLIYHIGRLPGNVVQLVVVDKGEYDGTSAEAVNDIEYQIYKKSGYGTLSKISGSPLSKAGLGGKIAVSMFFGVVLVMSAIYAYYYKLPEIRFPNIGGGGHSMLSRFNRRTESVVSLTRRDSAVTIASGIGVRAGTGSGTAFRNPLYDSKRGRVQVAESAVED